MNSDMPIPRKESEILQELENLCKSEGYAYALAYLSYYSNYIDLKDFYNNEKRVQQHWGSILRSEVELLTGLMIKAKLNDTLKMIPRENIEEYAEKSKELLQELHDRLNYDAFSELFTESALENKDEYKKILEEKGLRESFFYGAETAYEFQYKEFAIKKHTPNNDWFEREKGFDVDSMGKVINAVAEFTISKINAMHALCEEHKKNIFNLLNSNGTENFSDVKESLLEIFIINKKEIINKTQLSNEVTSKVLDAFSVIENPNNKEFKMHGDKNEAMFFPIIKIDNDCYLSFQPRYLMRNFYLSPDFWMREDASCKDKSEKNRGHFLEKACTECMMRVFAKNNIYTNVRILNNKGHKMGEMDVLVCYADKAIIIEAKSKRMTLDAIKGSVSDIRKDFKDGINKAYNQTLKCGELLLNEDYKLVDESNNTLDIRRNFSDIFLMCITSDTYPGLAHQVSLLLEPNPIEQEHNIIRPPYITDIFVLDVLCEFLDNPLYFLSYQDKKARYFKNIIPSNELSILGYHLAKSLFIPPEEGMYIDDDFTIEIDKSFGARREGTFGKKTPDGILTMYRGEIVENIIQQISVDEADYIIDFSNLLFDLSQKAVEDFNAQCQVLIEKVKRDKTLHDFTTIFDDIGVTVHASFDSEIEAHKKLISHCKIRKYKHKKDKWYGIFLNVESEDEPMKFFIASHAEWKESEIMEEIINAMSFATEVEI